MKNTFFHRVLVLCRFGIQSCVRLLGLSSKLWCQVESPVLRRYTRTGHQPFEGDKVRFDVILLAESGKFWSNDWAFLITSGQQFDEALLLLLVLELSLLVSFFLLRICC